jgi:LCP family protein required for cell wall assembly
MAKNKTLVILLMILVLVGGIYFVNNGIFIEEADKAGNTGTDETEETKINQMNILILGLDSRDGDFRGRTDTIMLAGFNPDNDSINLLSIPRDTRVKVKGEYLKINAAHVYGGPELTLKSLEDFLDIEIDHYVVINFDVFEQMVDIVGGIEVDVPIKMYYPAENIDLEPGLQVLNGEQALGYARYRYTEEGDIGRAKRQQQVVKLLLEKLFKVKNVIKIPEMINTVYSNLETDFSLTETMEIAGAASQVRSKPVNALVLPGTNKKLLYDEQKNLYLWYYIHDQNKLEEISEMFR